MSPLYTGKMWAWTCNKCGGTVHLQGDVPFPSDRCFMMGCGGTVRRAPERDYMAKWTAGDMEGERGT